MKTSWEFSQNWVLRVQGTFWGKQFFKRFLVSSDFLRSLSDFFQTIAKFFFAYASQNWILRVQRNILRINIKLGKQYFWTPIGFRLTFVSILTLFWHGRKNCNLRLHKTFWEKIFRENFIVSSLFLRLFPKKTQELEETMDRVDQAVFYVSRGTFRQKIFTFRNSFTSRFFWSLKKIAVFAENNWWGC